MKSIAWRLQQSPSCQNSAGVLISQRTPRYGNVYKRNGSACDFALVAGEPEALALRQKCTWFRRIPSEKQTGISRAYIPHQFIICTIIFRSDWIFWRTTTNWNSTIYANSVSMKSKWPHRGRFLHSKTCLQWILILFLCPLYSRIVLSMC